MDRVGLPTAVRSSARPRHRSVDGVRHMPSSSRSPNEIWMAIPRPRPAGETGGAVGQRLPIDSLDHGVVRRYPAHDVSELLADGGQNVRP